MRVRAKKTKLGRYFILASLLAGCVYPKVTPDPAEDCALEAFRAAGVAQGSIGATPEIARTQLEARLKTCAAFGRGIDPFQNKPWDGAPLAFDPSAARSEFTKSYETALSEEFCTERTAAIEHHRRQTLTVCPVQFPEAEAFYERHRDLIAANNNDINKSIEMNAELGRLNDAIFLAESKLRDPTPRYYDRKSVKAELYALTAARDDLQIEIDRLHAKHKANNQRRITTCEKRERARENTRFTEYCAALLIYPYGN